MRRGSVELDGEQFDKEGPQLLCRRRRLDRGRVDGQSRVKFRSKLAWSNEHPQASSLKSNRKHTRPSTCIMVDFSIPPLTYSTAIPALLCPLSRQSAGPITQICVWWREGKGRPLPLTSGHSIDESTRSETTAWTVSYDRECVRISSGLAFVVVVVAGLKTGFADCTCVPSARTISFRTLKFVELRPENRFDV